MASVPARPILAMTAMVLLAPALGIDLSGATATCILCAALLLVGLPHGTLDIERIRAATRQAHGGMIGLLALYVALAGIMFFFWQVAPLLALAVFLATATVHFSEDWRSMGEPLLGGAMALSLLAAPALLHGAELTAIFTAVTGMRSAGLVTDGLLMSAPIALLIALVGIFDLARRGEHALAAVAIALISSMVLAPPLVGFALFFCLFHSPLHLREAFREVTLTPLRRAMIVSLLTGAALGIAAVLSRIEWRGTLPASWLAATFMTLSILTIPHMLAPVLADGLLMRWSRQQRCLDRSC